MLDPIPPVTRLAAIVATVVVFLLARLERLWTDGHDKLSNNNNNNNNVEEKEQNLETEKSKDE